MELRGERECVACGTQWSYFETGTVVCPSCGSARSVGRGDRTTHTDAPVSLDLEAVTAGDDPLPEIADRVAERCRRYRHGRGFIDRGELRDLDDTYLTAAELRVVADAVRRGDGPDEDLELAFLELLEAARAGRRLPPAAVPVVLWGARATGYGEALHRYRRAVGRWGRDRALDRTERAGLDRIRATVTRVRHVDGPVDPEVLERLVRATRSLAAGLRGETSRVQEAIDLVADLDIGRSRE